MMDDEIITAAAGFRAILPQWFLDLGNAHSVEVQWLHDIDLIATAALLAAHAPMLDDFGEGFGAACLDSHADAEGYEDPKVYPCSLVRAIWPEAVGPSG
jgi:hypothetical protein